jgi:DNA-binding transcriptional LysR family regulator
MDHFHVLTAFVRVVEAGSFAAAAERLDRSVSAVSRSVAELEAHLGARLLNRTTRRLSLTETGRVFHERAVQLLADLEEAEAAVGASTLEPRGTLKLTCATTFAIRHLAPAIAAYEARYPRVRFDVELSDRFVDLVEEGFDLAIRIGPVRSQALIARRIGATALVCCAAPAYLARRGTPRSAGGPRRTRLPDLRVCAGAQRMAIHRCSRQAAPGARERARAREQRRDADRARVAGLGVNMEPDFIVAPARARGPAGAPAAGYDARVRRDQRGVPEPAAPVREGAQLHRLHRRTVCGRSGVAVAG